MKKIILLLIILLLTGCSFNNRKTYIENIMNVDLNKCIIIKDIDTHGGFLGDGEYFAKLLCKNFNITNNFKELPIEKEVYNVINIKECFNSGCVNVFEKYNIPNTIKGYYYYLDRSPELESSDNFSILIYDNKESLYYYEVDT